MATNTSISSATPSLATTPATTPTAMTTAATTAKRLGYTSPAVSSLSAASASASAASASAASATTASVICEEVFDEACLPSSEEINDYATLIGIEPGKETHLLYLAKEGLMAALPPEWKICYSEEKSGHYYHNTRTKQSQWDHPLDAVYRELVEQTRQKLATGGSVGAATPIIDNSDDVSQLDSGIRSMQGTDELLDDMSSPLNNGSSQNQHQQQQQQPQQPQQLKASGANSFPGPSGFSGGVSRFLESRSKNFGPIFQPVKNTRFEVAKTNSQISLAMKFGGQSPAAAGGETPGAAGAATQRSGGAFQLSGTGAMFLKSRRHLEQQQQPQTVAPTSSAAATATPPPIELGSTPGVKGILRDSSLTDMRRRFDRERDRDEDAVIVVGASGGGEDKKSVRFNLEDTIRLRSSPEEEDNNSLRKLNQSPELSINSEDEGGDESERDADNDDEEEEEEEEEDDDDDVWDEDVIDPDAMEGMCSLNPFISDANKSIRIINLPKAQTIQMLKSAQSSVPELEPVKLGESSGSGGGVTTTASSYLDKLKESAAVKPLYEDTDSDSKGSSVRSFIINKSEQESLHSSTTPAGNNPFDLDELGRKHSHELEQLQRKSAQSAAQLATDKLGLRSLKMASKLVGLLKQKDSNSQSSASGEGVLNEAAALQQLQQDMEHVKREHETRLKSLRHEYDLRLTSHQHQLEEAFELQLEEYRSQLEHQLQAKRAQVVSEHKARMATLQSNHAELLHELERDLRSEQEILRREHAAKLTQMRDKLAHELELEKQRLRDTGEERLYEKVRCEKRLLEDKYRCLKEKYVRLKTDVKLSLERRSRRREAQALQQHNNAHHHGTHHGHHNNHTNTNTTTGSETERSISQKPSIGNSENRSLSYSEQATAAGGLSPATTGGSQGAAAKVKPPVPPKTHLSKPGIASKYIKTLQLQDDTNTSLSQSDTTISNNYSKGRYLAAMATPTATPTPSASAVVLSDNGNSDSEAVALQQQENNNNNNNKSLSVVQPRKKLFSRTKSASTSRLNSDNSNNYGKQQPQQQQLVEQRPCTPVENLRHQLQKLEDLEDQFPEHTLDTTYHLRYPFTDISNEHAAVVGSVVGSELEFFKHRIHLERDSVRRAKESLRTQRTNFRARQREIKQRHKTIALAAPRHSLDQLIQEEKELTEMEVNLHRTRALLGEKVIRLRHLEQSLLRIYEKEKPTLEQEPKDDATTLSDLSSHSSSGFSSTDFASGADLHKRKEYFQQESNECIQNLEILNAEIREILDILSQKQQHQHQTASHQALSTLNMGMSMPPMISPNELSWSHMLSQQQQHQQSSSAVAAMPTLQSSSSTHSLSGATTQQTQAAAVAAAAAAAAAVHAPQSIPTLADRLETYRQLAAGRMHSSMGGAILAANTIVSQSPRAVNYTTSLVERTRDLRNWLRQAKTEHELLTGMGMQHGLAMHSASGAGGISGIGAAIGGNSSGGSSASGGGGGGGGATASVVVPAAGTATGTGTTAGAAVATAAAAQTNL
ncbi:kinesin-related protein 4 [Drosophila sulfurigaster albostrigata]|uniref:kinesin-related protein 4 n=1 Tax=Drosophila sulfurigaster albostrigata TaxID=89887 RepID=UPI002D21D989|nr:kinesin-related protein 4 [Drosophila sulfurigaster albostrigata]XP_062138380.1 kinesin-related protein 4 [Drosophila sulfurigaster albostrigata]